MDIFFFNDYPNCFKTCLKVLFFLMGNIKIIKHKNLLQCQLLELLLSRRVHGSFYNAEGQNFLVELSRCF